MIKCENCGGVNPTNFKHCGKCGTSLLPPPAIVVCSKCYTKNPGTLSFCNHCGEKLVPLVVKAGTGLALGCVGFYAALLFIVVMVAMMALLL